MRQTASRDGAAGNLTRRTQAQYERDPGDAYTAVDVAFLAQQRLDTLGVTSGGWGYEVGDTGTVNKAGAIEGEYVVDAVYAAQDITAATLSPRVFTVAGDYRIAFPAGATVTVAGSTANDGDYTVVSVEFTDPDTEITVSEALTDETADGTIDAQAVETVSVGTNAGGNYGDAAPQEGVATIALTGVGQGLTVTLGGQTPAGGLIHSTGQEFGYAASAFGLSDAVEVRGSPRNSRVWPIADGTNEYLTVNTSEIRTEAAGARITLRRV